MIRRQYFEALFYKIGSSALIGLLMRKYQGKIIMLCYHRIAPDGESSRVFDPVHLNTVSAARFEEQIRYLTENYQAISIQEVADCLIDESGKKYVVITIDDGYKDTIEYALPILERYNVPAVVYLNTCYPDEGEEIWTHEIVDIINSKDVISFDFNGNKYYWQLNNTDDRRKCFSELTRLISLSARNRPEIMSLLRGKAARSSGGALKYALTWDEIRKLDVHPLITIGAHTHNHLSLAGLTAAEAEYEMVHSRKRLEEELGHNIEHFAYPFGGPDHAGKKEFELAERCGFKTAVTVMNAGIHTEHIEHLFALPRYAVSERDAFPRLKAKISGWEAFVRHRGRVVVI